MATAFKIVLGPQDKGNYYHGRYNEAAFAKVSELLQHDMEHHHIIFSGLRHDHIVHALLTVLGLGVSVEELDEIYDRERSYQKPRYPVDEDVVTAMADPEKFKEYLDQQPPYSNFLLFFQREIETKGVKQTLEEHVFADSDHARRLLIRLFTSIWHGYLHLGYALEYNQPALVAQALAMSSVHDPESNRLEPFFLEAEKLAGGPGQTGKKTLAEIMAEIRENKKLVASSDGNNEINRPKNVMVNAPEEAIKYAAQYSLSADQLDERVDEMIDTGILTIATTPSYNPEGERPKIDFWFLHIVNTFAMLPSLVHHEWVSKDNAVRLLEWAGRNHLLTYAAHRAPRITTEEVDGYQIKRPWNELFDYVVNHPTDDGHLQKCIRALAYADKRFEGRTAMNGLRCKPDTFLELGNMVADRVPYSCKTSAQRWILFFQ